MAPVQELVRHQGLVKVLVPAKAMALAVFQVIP